MAIHYVEQNDSDPSMTRHSAPEPTIRRLDDHEHTASESSSSGSSSSKPSTPEQPDAEPVKPADEKKPGEADTPVYVPRADRLNQTPSKGNAQGLFLPDCCVFVGKYVSPSLI